MDYESVSYSRPSYKGVGDAIRQARLAKGWTLETAAEKADINDKYLGQLETSPGANPSLKVLRNLSRVLGKSVGHLAGDEDVQIEEQVSILVELLQSLENRKCR